MSILTANKLRLSYGAFDVFRGISGAIANDSKIGLIGPNGIGKTSLLLILAGLKQPTEGQVYFAKSRRLGYLQQEAVDAFASELETLSANARLDVEDFLAAVATGEVTHDAAPAG